ncbi:MAG: hypothetical protein FWD91_03820 [Treponema sp.]|nr:hypothetical protein [Treponema sp.]
MSFFCLLWVPVFYFFWRGITAVNTSGWVWALIAGSIAALLQSFIGPVISPEGFGVSRWVSGFVDIVALPALVPLVVYLLFFYLRLVSGSPDFANFALLWIVPASIFRSLAGSYSPNDPIMLVLVPVLWTAIIVGVSFFITIIQNSALAGIILSSVAIIAVPLAAATSYWAFFSQSNLVGVLFLIVAIAPMFVSAITSFRGVGE